MRPYSSSYYGTTDRHSPPVPYSSAQNPNRNSNTSDGDVPEGAPLLFSFVSRMASQRQTQGWNGNGRRFMNGTKQVGNFLWSSAIFILTITVPLLLLGAVVYLVIQIGIIGMVYLDKFILMVLELLKGRSLYVLPSEAKMVIAPDARNVIWDPTGEKMSGASEEVIALATLDPPVYMISDDHAMRKDKNFKASIDGRIEPARYIRCSGTGLSDPRWFNRGIEHFREKNMGGEDYVLFFDGDLRKCWMMTDRMLRIQITIGGAKLDWFEDGYQ